MNEKIDCEQNNKEAINIFANKLKSKFENKFFFELKKHLKIYSPNALCLFPYLFFHIEI